MIEIELYRRLLSENFQKVERSFATLQQSLQKCMGIGIKEVYTFEESEAFDSLTSKFARTSDVFIQKVLRSMFILLHEGKPTLIDLANRAEALDIIANADALLAIRDVRNQISHEYEDSGLISIYGQIFELAGLLEKDIELAKRFATGYGWLNV